MTEEREKRNKRIAAITSVGVHVLLFVVFLFAVAWRAPDPPLPEFGIELNFGLDTQGSGDLQPETPVGANQDADKMQPVQNEELQPEEKASEAKPVESKPVTQQVTTKQESPFVMKEEKNDSKPIEKPKESVEEKKDVKVNPQIDSKAVYKPNSEKTEGKTGEPVTHGDDVNKTGDKGDPKGSLDSNALYGKSGGGAGGSSLDLAGWRWDDIPKPNVPNNESGRVVFEIKVDADGEIISIRTIERSVSLEAENICKREIEKLTFTKTGTNVPSVSTGKITFVVRSN